jgi:acyl-CoA synthetase (AMP-forming)/AMP-acid ligase II
MNTTDFLAISAAIVPERTAIIFEDGRYNFAKLADRVNNLALAMRQQGVVKGDRVAFLQVNTNACVEVYFATAKLGAIYLPLNFRAKEDELTYMINNAGLKMAFAGERYLPLVENILPRLDKPLKVVTLEDRRDGILYYQDMVAGHTDDEITEDIDDDDTTILMYTAGTTGRPKGVMLSHNSFSIYMLENVSPPDPETEERNILTVPLYHIAGMQAMMAAIYGGRTTIIERQFEPVEWMTLVQREKVNRAMMVPTMLKQLLDHSDSDKYDLSSIKVITYGAAPITLDIIRKAVARFPGASFINAFGQTESASTITQLRSEDTQLSGEDVEDEAKLKRLTSIGKPLSDIEMKVIDEAGNTLEADEPGELLAKGPRIMSGYWDAEDQQNSPIDAEGWLHTGDVGYYDEDGYYYLTGRAKDIIIRAGENISPEELESVIRAYPGIEDVAVIGVPHPEWGEEPLAVVVCKNGVECSADDVMEYCRQKLASYKRPRQVDFVDELPRNPMGKVLKRVLREKYGQF